MRQHQELFENVRTKTGMYFQQESYAVVAAFILGYDTACEGGVLAGFREWLAVARKTPANLAWTAAVLHAAFPEVETPQDACLASRAAERHAIDTLFRLISEFDVVRGTPDSLKSIFVAFAALSG